MPKWTQQAARLFLSRWVKVGRDRSVDSTRYSMMYPRLALMTVLLSLVAISPAFGEKEVDCGALKTKLTQKRQQLSEHVDALRKLNEQGELVIMGVMTQRVHELLDEMIKLQEQGSACPDLGQPKPVSGLDSVKSDASEYTSMGCDELRKVLFALLQKTSALKRRQNSVFSALSAAEKAELQDVEGALKEVKAAIKTKCSPAPAPTPPRLLHRR
ncbi:MAG: hypothetical protein HY914_06225 [Desulfomonile tiedjei]|nr:hypothetical protein [Desulfomonile tiedjei]